MRCSRATHPPGWLLLVAALLLPACGGGEEGAAVRRAETPADALFQRYTRALAANDGNATLACILPRGRNETVAAYAALAFAFASAEERAGELNPLLQRHGVAFHLGWATRGKLEEPVADKGALLGELLAFLKQHDIARKWINAYPEIPAYVTDGLLMPLPWSVLDSTVTGETGEVTAMVQHRKQAVRCRFPCRRVADVWYLDPPQAVWELVR